VAVARHGSFELEPFERQGRTQEVAGRSAERLEDSASRSRPMSSPAQTVTRWWAEKPA
jgi:hypothetical protein